MANGRSSGVRTKYRARRVEYNGVTYHSRAEAERAGELDLLIKAGEIVEWIRQPTVWLGVPENVYRPDFLVIARRRGLVSDSTVSDGLAWYEDVKGFETAKFRRDKKLWLAYGRLPLKIRKKGRVVEVLDPIAWRRARKEFATLAKDP